MAAACADGVPEAGAFAPRAGRRPARPADLVAASGVPELDRWQAQVLGRVLARGAVGLHSEGLGDDAIRAAQLVPVPDLDEAVEDSLAGIGPRPASPCCRRGRSPLPPCASERGYPFRCVIHKMLDGSHCDVIIRDGRFTHRSPIARAATFPYHSHSFGVA